MKRSLRLKPQTIFLIIFILLMTVFSVIYFLYWTSLISEIIIVVLIVMSYWFLALYLYLQNKDRKNEINQIQEVFDFYSTQLMNEAGVGIIIFNEKKKIIWFSSLIKQRFSNKLLGKNILEVSEKLFDLINNREGEIIIEKNNLYYSVQIFYSKKVILIIDITQNYLANQYYENEKFVLGLVDIDSYHQYQTILEEEVLFKVDLSVAKLLDHLSLEYGVVYKKYGPGKFLLITNNSAIKKMQKVEFKFVRVLQRYSKKIGVKISLSFGFGTGSTNYSEIQKNARTALSQSHARGGDQITIVSSVNDNVYYGGTSEALHEPSRIKIKAISDKLSYVLKRDDLISRVIITGHVNADLDAMGAALGLVMIARAAKKEVFIANNIFDKTTTKAINRWIPEEVLLFIKPNKAKRMVTSRTLVIVVDTTSEKRIESIEAVLKAKKSNIFIFDHHRSSKKLSFNCLPEHLYVDTTASSTCEIITEIIRFIPFKVKMSKAVSQFMLSGIYLDTNNFQKTTSYKTYDAASWLEKKGAIPQETVDMLKPEEDESKIILQIKSKVQEIKPGFVLSVYDGELESHVIAAGANELLRTADRKAAFVIAKVPGKNEYHMSARSINVNVQIITELIGGGGHFSAAAAVTSEPLDVFKSNLIEAIVSVRTNENNSN